MRIDNEKEYLVDLKWPHLLPENVQQTQNVRCTVVAANDASPNRLQTFQLTGWRGAGWHMVFPDESTQ